MAGGKQGNAPPAHPTKAALLAELHKRFGESAPRPMGRGVPQAFPHTPTGCLALDNALGIGGWPHGRMVEVYGPESSGKTTLAIHAVVGAQRMGQLAAFVDAEHALDMRYAEALGVNGDDLLLSQPDNGEQALEIVLSLVSSGAVGLVVVDSVAALTPKAEIDGDMGDSHMGLHARMMSQAMRKLNAAVMHSGCVLMFINQTRSKIGVVFGNPETTPGGAALRFYATMRVRVQNAGKMKEGEDTTGVKVKASVVKNKLAAPFTVAEYTITFGIGVDHVAEVLDRAVDADVVQKSGAWFAFQGERLGNGRLRALAALREAPDVLKAIEAQL